MDNVITAGRYQLITVVDREIVVAYFSKIADARKQMQTELREALGIDPDADFEESAGEQGEGYEIGPMGAWCNAKFNWDWIIVDLVEELKANLVG